MKTASGVDVKSLAAGYKIAVSDVSGGVLEVAITDFIKGQAHGYSATFLPTPAELRQYCEKIAQFAQSQIRYAQCLLEAKELEPPKRISPDRLAALMDEVGNTPTSHVKH